VSGHIVVEVKGARRSLPPASVSSLLRPHYQKLLFRSKWQTICLLSRAKDYRPLVLLSFRHEKFTTHYASRTRKRKRGRPALQLR
jgi:hypothetical protein